MVCIRVQGDSMEPSIISGSLIAIDRSQRNQGALIEKVIVARHNDDGTVVKRLRERDGKIWLISDNPFHSAMELTQEWAIIGRVVWWIAKPE